MPYSRNTFFKPSDKYKNAWSLTPQGRSLSVSGYSTGSLYATLSSSIPIFYVLMFLAIAFDIYLGFSVLAKSGVNIMLIVGAILFDFFFAVAPVLLSPFSKIFNHTYINNKIFKGELEMMTKRKENNDAHHKDRIYLELKSYRNKKIVSKLISLIFAVLIFAIAGWKIFTYYSVLPPGFSIFSMVNGKIVIIFSFLCAVFHLIGSEKALAHFNFWLIKNKEYNNYIRKTDIVKPEKTIIPLDFEANFKIANSGNTELIINEKGEAELAFIHIIWDDEIKELIEHQTDQNAMRAIAIKSKENQLQ
ncbi:hypothetical protein [Polaribacter sp.]|uniref:hypothetical protein n=1 Tax=Polaribacter sp. TaxID=1920175 RepID=UPI003EF82C45